MLNKQSRRLRGTTLIEVLLGLALLSTVMTSAIIARGRFLRQWGDADRRVRLAQGVDQLMNDLITHPASDLGNARGYVPSVPNAVWQTHLINDPAAGSVGCVKVELLASFAGRDASLTRIEFLVQKPAPATQPTRLR